MYRHICWYSKTIRKRLEIKSRELKELVWFVEPNINVDPDIALERRLDRRKLKHAIETLQMWSVRNVVIAAYHARPLGLLHTRLTKYAEQVAAIANQWADQMMRKSMNVEPETGATAIDASQEEEEEDW